MSVVLSLSFDKVFHWNCDSQTQMVGFNKRQTKVPIERCLNADSIFRLIANIN